MTPPVPTCPPDALPLDPPWPPLAGAPPVSFEPPPVSPWSCPPVEAPAVPPFDDVVPPDLPPFPVEEPPVELPPLLGPESEGAAVWKSWPPHEQRKSVRKPESHVVPCARRRIPSSVAATSGTSGTGLPGSRERNGKRTEILRATDRYVRCYRLLSRELTKYEANGLG